MRCCRFLILIVFSFNVTGTLAQQGIHYFFRHISQADGLLHNQVLSVTQDGKGFIWIASAGGLQRYDGSRFVNYRDMLSNPTEGLTTGAEMYVDKKDNLLWVSNNADFEIMELYKNRFTTYYRNDLLKNPAFAFRSYQDGNNATWLLGDHCAYQYDRLAGRSPISHVNIFPPDTRRAAFIAADSSGNTWVATETRLYLFDKKSEKVYSDAYNPEHHPLLDVAFSKKGQRLLRFIMKDSRQNIWVTTWGDRFFKYDAGTKKVTTYLISAIKSKEEGHKTTPAGLLINCMLEDDNHVLWIGTENAGLLRYNNAVDRFDYCTTREKNSDNIRYDYMILSIFQDKEQNIWVGTDKGLSIFNPYRSYFKAVRHEEDNPLSIGKSEMLSLIQTTRGDVFIGTWGGGMAVYDSTLRFLKNVSFPGPAEKNFIWCFVQVDQTTLWIGCQHGYLIVYNIATGGSQTLRPPEMEGFTIRCMQKDKMGNIWFGLHNGKIVEWDKVNGRFMPYGAGLRDSLKQAAFINNIFIDTSQHCWVSTETGLKEFDCMKRVFVHTWLPEKNKPNTLLGKSCQGIEQYNDSVMIIATVYGGLNFFNTKSGTFTHLGMADGLPSNTIYAIKKDSLGYIWFTTDYGIYRFNPAERKFIRYNIEPVLINSSFKANRFYPLKDGQWITFTLAEAISFFPLKKEYPENARPNLEITGFKIFDTPLFIDSLFLEDKPVRLSYKENFFTVEFAVLNFTGPQQTNYYYRLAGVDDDWVNGGNKRFASYTDLQPGQYNFSVRSENGHGDGEMRMLKIVIDPPFWKSPWFMVLLTTVGACLIYLSVKWRMTTVRNQEKTKILFNKEMSEMEMKALRSQMNPHFIFNCINSIDGLIQGNDKYHATVYLNKFARLLRNVLDSSKQNAVLFSNDIQTLQLYMELEVLRHENKFRTILDIDPELINSDYRVPPLIIQPFVENAILHGLKNKDGNEGILKVEIVKVEDTIRYTITDNGIGRAAAKSIIQTTGSHYGMQISYDRIKLFNKEETASVKITDLYFSDMPCGTQVAVNLKII